MAVNKLVYYIIPLIVLGLIAWWQFGFGGLFENLKGGVKGVIEMAPNVSIGAEEELATEPTIPREHEEAINNLVETIEKMVTSPKKNCFLNYKLLGKNYGTNSGMPSLGEGGTTISFQLKGDKTEMLIAGGAGGKQEVTRLRKEIAGFKPCVIAGSNEITKNFFNRYLGQGQILGDNYKPVSIINIFYDTDGDNGNAIRVPEFGNEPVNDEGDNFEDEGWLFKAEDGSICFFPTNKVMSADDDGLVYGNINQINTKVGVVGSGLDYCYTWTE
ncbi:MAG: hypothetical protein ABH824_03935 [Nanoarchaeota archaeon]|nr:hypothetical protein [Nanoarchaeota archaeon]MBU1632564.1 hypothetical protein [Nanoarchaeota archaeon]MBU1876583.1 hypothetical protein [Nanoarchaeota archaeon]